MVNYLLHRTSIPCHLSLQHFTSVVISLQTFIRHRVPAKTLQINHAVIFSASTHLRGRGRKCFYFLLPAVIFICVSNSTARLPLSVRSVTACSAGTGRSYGRPWWSNTSCVWVDFSSLPDPLWQVATCQTCCLCCLCCRHWLELWVSEVFFLPPFVCIGFCSLSCTRPYRYHGDLSEYNSGNPVVEHAQKDLEMYVNHLCLDLTLQTGSNLFLQVKQTQELDRIATCYVRRHWQVEGGIYRTWLWQTCLSVVVRSLTQRGWSLFLKRFCASTLYWILQFCTHKKYFWSSTILYVYIHY